MRIESTRTISRSVVVASVEEHRKRYPHDTIESIDDKSYIGSCESCGVALLDDDQYITTVDDCYLCPKCTPTPEEAREQMGEDKYRRDGAPNTIPWSAMSEGAKESWRSWAEQAARDE